MASLLATLITALAFASAPAYAARRRGGAAMVCQWDGSKHNLVQPSSDILSSSDAWAPKNGRISLTNDCQFWLNSNCSVIQQTLGCNDGIGCTKEKCVVNDPNNCKPFPACKYRPAACVYSQTCNSDKMSRANPDILTGKVKVPAPRDACIWDSNSQSFSFEKNWPFWRQLKQKDTWAPPPGRSTRSGDCKYVLNDRCKIRSNPGGCGDGKSCQWSGNKNWPKSCSPFPTCFFRSAKCASSSPTPSSSPPSPSSSSSPVSNSNSNSNSNSGSSSSSSNNNNNEKKSSSDSQKVDDVNPIARASSIGSNNFDQVSSGGDGGDGGSDGNNFKPEDFGAKADGSSDDRDAIVSALKAACQDAQSSKNNNGGGRASVTFQGGKTYFSSMVTLDGEKVGGCGNGITIKLLGTLQAASWCGAYNGQVDSLAAALVINKVDGITIKGSGTIVGAGENWWNGQNSACDKPQGLSIRYSDRVTLKGITIKHPAQMHLILHVNKDVLIDGLITDTPYPDSSLNSVNTDSIHLEEVNGAVIKNCKLRGGDDAMSIVDGCRNILVDNMSVQNTHGFSIGSLGKGLTTGCVRDIVFKNLNIKDALYGARIKTYQGGQGCVRNITWSNVKLQGIGLNGILIDQWYCNNKASGTCGSSNMNVAVSDINFENFSGQVNKPANDGAGVITLRCSDYVPCKDIVFKNINLDGSGQTIDNAFISTDNVSPYIQGRDGSKQPITGDEDAHIQSMRNVCYK